MVLDSIAKHLPTPLRQVLDYAAHLTFHREEVTTTYAQIITLQNEAMLRKEIIEESSTLSQQKV